MAVFCRTVRLSPDTYNPEQTVFAMICQCQLELAGEEGVWRGGGNSCTWIYTETYWEIDSPDLNNSYNPPYSFRVSVLKADEVTLCYITLKTH